MGRNKDFEKMRFRGLKDTLHVLDGAHLFETLVREGNAFSRFAEQTQSGGHINTTAVSEL